MCRTFSLLYSLFPGLRFVMFEESKLFLTIFSDPIASQLIPFQYVWYSALNYFSNPWAFLILLYLLYRFNLNSVR